MLLVNDQLFRFVRDDDPALRILEMLDYFVGIVE